LSSAGALLLPQPGAAASLGGFECKAQHWFWAFVYEPNQVAKPAIRCPNHADSTTAGDGILVYDNELPGYEELSHEDMDGGGAGPSSLL
jgi:hypothetical protein